MSKFVYTVWFRNNSLPKEDQDYEWPACLVIHVSLKAEAQEWGDFLAGRKCENDPEVEFVRSEVLLPGDQCFHNVKWDEIPSVVYGEEASDEKLGW
jgi:hypothetical protein